MELSIYNFDNYRTYIKSKVKAEKSNWGLWAKLAKAAACQPTYLTQAMGAKANLTADHILGIAKYWALSIDDTDFFLLLLEYGRAGTPALKKYLYEKIRKIKSEREDLAKRLALPKLEIGEKETIYYSTWYWSALHVIVTIPEFQTTASIARHLCLPVELVEVSLQNLERLNFVRKQGVQWKIGTADIHIPQSSPLIGVHHNNWRQRAVLDATLPNAHGVHYTAVYSLSVLDFEHLKEKMRDYIEHSRRVVQPSAEEKLVCLACDLFEV
jgi:uncharacterized protein (TIGR02147 family)